MFYKLRILISCFPQLQSIIGNNHITQNNDDCGPDSGGLYSFESDKSGFHQHKAKLNHKKCSLWSKAPRLYFVFFNANKNFFSLFIKRFKQKLLLRWQRALITTEDKLHRLYAGRTN